MSRPPIIRKSEIERAVKSALACGLTVTRVEIDGGKLVIYTTATEAQETPLEAWRRTNGKS
jgi:hypothetical protein